MLRTGEHLRALLVPGEILASAGNEATSPKGPYSQSQKKLRKKERITTIITVIVSFFLFSLFSL